MEIIYCFNLILIFFLNIFQVYYLSRFFKFSFINPLSIMFIMQLPYLFFQIIVGPVILIPDGLFDKYFNFAILMTNISGICNFLVVYFVVNFMRKNFRLIHLIEKWPSFSLKLSRMYFLSAFFFILAFLCFYLVSTNSFGFINWLQNPRVGYQLYRTGAGQYYALCLSFLSLSYVLLSLAFNKNRNLILLSIVSIFFVYFLGSKLFVLSFAEYGIIRLWLNKYNHLSKVLLVILPSTFLILLYNFFSTQTEIDITDVLQYFDYYKNSMMYYQAYFNNELDLFYGKIFFTGFWEMIPRAIYPEKPYVYGIMNVNEFFFPGAAENSFYPAFGGPIAAFADFGIIGVIFSSLFNINNIINTVFYYYLYNNINLADIRRNSNKLYLYIWFLAPTFLGYFIFPINLIAFIGIVFIIDFINRVRWS